MTSPPGATSSGLALEFEGTRRHTVLPVGRNGLDAEELAPEPGVRPRL